MVITNCEKTTPLAGLMKLILNNIIKSDLSRVKRKYAEKTGVYPGAVVIAAAGRKI